MSTPKIEYRTDGGAQRTWTAKAEKAYQASRQASKPKAAPAAATKTAKPKSGKRG